MSWSFPSGADTYASVGVGALPQNGAAISVWWMIRPTNGDNGMFRGLEAAANRIGMLSFANQTFTANDGTGGPTLLLNQWQVIGFDDVGGGTVRWHHCTDLTGTPTWAHSNGTAGGDRSGVIDDLRLGQGPDAFRMRGHIAAGAIANSRLGDAGFVALGVTSMATWRSAAVCAWQFNVAVSGTALIDLTGGTANQTSLTGTPTLDTGQEPPNWTYYAPAVSGTASAVLGGVVGTGSGSRAKSGSASAVLGGLVSTAQARRQRSSGAGWYSLLDIYAEAAQVRRDELARPPTACPNDGEPLTGGPSGVLFCRFDGWVWDGVNR